MFIISSSEEERKKRGKKIERIRGGRILKERTKNNREITKTKQNGNRRKKGENIQAEAS